MENQQLLQVQDGDKLLQAVLHSRISDKGVEVETINGWEQVLIPVSTVWFGIESAQGQREAEETLLNKDVPGNTKGPMARDQGKETNKMSKYKYIKVNSSLLWGENNLTKEMLAMVASGQYDTIINTEDFTYFDADENTWKEIDGTNGVGGSDG